MDVKVAMKDSKFRAILPSEITEDVIRYLHNPGCGSCGVKLFRKILRDCKSQLRQYFPDSEIADESEEMAKLAQNHWTVINCNIDELEDKLKRLSPGRKQIDVARSQDQVTVVVNELDIIF